MLKLKLIDEGDLGQLSAFFEENNVQAILDTFSPFTLTEETARWIACQSHQDRYYLGLNQDEMIGFSMLRGWDEGFSVPSFGIFIDHRCHGKGYGKELLDLTIDAARELGCSQIRLSVFASNPAARKIYRSRGFTERENIPVEHKGVMDEKIIMLKDLRGRNG